MLCLHLYCLVRKSLKLDSWRNTLPGSAVKNASCLGLVVIMQIQILLVTLGVSELTYPSDVTVSQILNVGNRSEGEGLVFKGSYDWIEWRKRTINDHIP